MLNDQISCPTYARDLAELIQNIIVEKNCLNFGVYHFSNKGETSWYNFAEEVFALSNLNTKVLPITSKKYAAKAKRPPCSLLDSTKIKIDFEIELKDWKLSLKESLNRRAL